MRRVIPRREFPRPIVRGEGVPVSGVEENAPGAWHRRAASFEKKGRLCLCFGGADYIADAYVTGSSPRIIRAAATSSISA